MYRSARPITRIAAILAFSLGLTGCDIAVDGHGGLGVELSTGKAQDEWTRSYQLAPGGRLEIINVNGRISAEATDGQSVEVRADRTAKALSDDSARELLGKIEMREEVSADRVRVEVRAPRFSGGPSGHEIKWTVKVPKGVAVDLRTINGGVRLDRLEGEVRARSTNGGIVGEALNASSVDAQVTNGGVEINLVNAPSSGSIDLESVNGGVTLSLPATAKADITARCVNGGISIDGVDIEVVGEQTRRRLDGKINGGGARISMETVNGGVKIRSTGSARNSS